MNLQTDDSLFGLGAASLARAMPMHLCLNAAGTIVSAGPTLAKVAGIPLLGQHFFDILEIRRPTGLRNLADVLRNPGRRLHLSLRDQPESDMRGLAEPLAGGGVLLNLSFGIDLPAAVRRHRLSDADFAPTDLAVELMFLIEVKTMVMDELRALNQRLQGAKSQAEEEALTDQLTGLRNRRAMDAQLDAMIASEKPFSIMHLDLDWFKEVNDTHGHAAGDHVLRKVAQILTELRPDPSHFVARVGGDEFVMILPGLVEDAGLTALAADIVTQVSEPIEIVGRSCRVSASIGISVSTSYARPVAETMLADADRALYRSKRGGRSRASRHTA